MYFQRISRTLGKKNILNNFTSNFSKIPKAREDSAPEIKSSRFLLQIENPLLLILLKHYIIHLVMKKAPEKDDAAAAYFKIA